MSICSDSTPLAGQVAVVTGGSSGIGAATVRELSQLGARVAAFDLAESPESPAALTLTCDITDASDVDRCMGRYGQALGPPDILVPCAGATGAHPFVDFPDG